MALFRRSDRSASRIEDFWLWWRGEGRALAEATIERRPGGDFAAAINARLKPLGGPDWELGPGETSTHVLVVTAGGDPDLLAVTRRLLLAAPPPDEVWSYADSRPPLADPESRGVRVDGVSFDFGSIRVAARLEELRFDVQVHHPAFADVGEKTRQQVAFLALDKALGERDTELWIGQVHVARTAPLDGFGLVALRAVVQDLVRQHTDADGRPAWVTLEGEGPGGPLIGAARVPLHPYTSPTFDTYVAVVVPYVHRTGEGLPAAESLEHLRELEDRLGRQLGTAGAVVAHQSVAGVRTLHVYADSTADVVPGVRRLAQEWREAPASVHQARDPAWDSVRHLRP